jgi:PAT family beta-lactamase induction signal transducer AmpG|tara:strand:- start:2506 stop:3831 length:1326 start_codon:yes stop_codon:yes gene_type:complete
MVKVDAAGRWPEAWRLYGNRRQLAIFLMGFSSGLPLLLGFSTLSYWLSTAGIDRTTIGLFAAVSTPYAFKFAWAPLLDHWKLPLFHRLLGRRRGWILFLQLLLVGAIVWLGSSDPLAAPLAMALAALAVASLSASQDIVIDAYRIEILSAAEQGAGAAVTQAGYRVGMIAAGAGALALSDYLSWFLVFIIMAALVGVGMLGVLIGPEPRRPGAAALEDSAAQPWPGFMKRAVIAPLADFVARPGWWLILLFVLLYKYGDAIAGTMANPFYRELGFTGTEIASVTKLLGVAATLLGVFIGGWLVARVGLVKALLAGGVLQALSNLLFAWMAARGFQPGAVADLDFLALAVGVDSFTGGLGSAAFVAYLSSLCNLAFTGTQYALLTSLMAFGRTLLSTGSGWLVDQSGWVEFFIATTFLALPGLLLLMIIARRYSGKPLAVGA